MFNSTDKKEIKGIKAHFSSKLSKDILDYTVNVAFEWSRYIFTRRVGKKQFGFCTHCRKEYPTDGLKHNDKAICPQCKSGCTVKASGKGRKYMVDEVYFVYYEKSAVNPEVITARGIYAIRDYRGDYYKVETKFAHKALYLFEPGESKMLSGPYVYYSEIDNLIHNSDNWTKASSIYSFCDSGHMSNIRNYCSYDSISNAIKNTPFQYSTWEHYTDGDMVKFFDHYAKYPGIEFLTKLGFEELVEAKLRGNKTYSAIYWQGKTIQKILKLNKGDIREIRESSIPVGPLGLRLYQLSKADGSNLSISHIYEIAREYGYAMKDLLGLLKYNSLGKLDRYLNKQFEQLPESRYHTIYSVFSDYRDYISDCIHLGMDLNVQNVLFPRNLHRAHQNTIKQIKLKEDRELDEKINLRVKQLDKYYFEENGLLIRPAVSTKELINEGKSLHHCVGTYAKRYAKGETDILVIRKAADPEKPFYTMEVSGSFMRQCRGYKNCDMKPEVKAFVERFKEEKLSAKKNKAEPKGRQEVAV